MVLTFIRGNVFIKRPDNDNDRMVRWVLLQENCALVVFVGTTRQLENNSNNTLDLNYKSNNWNSMK